MSDARTEAERLRILTFWWMLELFSPQPVPALTRKATRPSDRQVIEWKPGEPLPWNKFAPPEPVGGTPRVWLHTVYLGVYKLEATYESLGRVFGEDPDAYDKRPDGESACAGLLINQDGRLIADSAVLSSALWAVGRIHDPGPQDPRWMDGFDEAVEAFTEVVDAYEGERRDAWGDEQPPPYDAESLTRLLKIAHTAARVDGYEDLASDRVTIESVAVSARRAEESADTDFLNSFYLDDLATVRSQVARGNVGAALAAYLTGDACLATGYRIDAVARPDVVDAGTVIDRLPKGRWPAKPEHPLALSQQFAVNQALNDLAPTVCMTGVNGPSDGSSSTKPAKPAPSTPPARSGAPGAWSPSATPSNWNLWSPSPRRPSAASPTAMASQQHGYRPKPLSRPSPTASLHSERPWTRARRRFGSVRLCEFTVAVTTPCSLSATRSPTTASWSTASTASSMIPASPTASTAQRHR